MSRNVSVLERNGYVARRRSADDARVVDVSLTAHGRKALTTLECGERDVLDQVYAKIPAPEREAVVKALERLRSCVIEDSGAASCCPPHASIRGQRRGQQRGQRP